MKHAAALVTRLAVYAVALFVVVTARLPGAAVTTAVRTTAGPDLDPIRLLIAAVLLTGILIELLRRRAIWH